MNRYRKTRNLPRQAMKTLEHRRRDVKKFIRHMDKYNRYEVCVGAKTYRYVADQCYWEVLDDEVDERKARSEKKAQSPRDMLESTVIWFYHLTDAEQKACDENIKQMCAQWEVQDGGLYDDVQVVPRTSAFKQMKATDAQFEEWWVQYPQKRSKVTAKAAFSKAVFELTADMSRPDALKLLATKLAEYKRTLDPSFIKHAATWLNAGEYLSEFQGSSLTEGAWIAHDPKETEGMTANDIINQMTGAA